MAKLPIPKLPASFKYNSSKLGAGKSAPTSSINDTLSAASANYVRPTRAPLSRVANINKGSSPDDIANTYKKLTAPARPARPASPKAAQAPVKSRGGRQRELESAFTGKGSNDYFRRHRSAPKTSYSASDREAYVTRKQANKTRGREEGVRISQGRDKEAVDLLNKPASGTVDDMVARNKALGREDKINARARKSAPRVQASGEAGSRTSRKSAEAAETSSRVNLGEAIGDGTFAGQASGSLKMARKNFSTQMEERGGAASYMGRAAVQGAVWGAGIGGSVSAAQGGDFWAGAKEGAFKGAVGVAGFKGLRAASGTSSTGLKSIGDTFGNSKAVWQHHGKGNVSKSVDSIQQLNSDVSRVVKR